MKRARSTRTLEHEYDGVLPLDCLVQICEHADAITQRMVANTCKYLHVQKRLPRIPLCFDSCKPSLLTAELTRHVRKSTKALSTCAPLDVLKEAVPYMKRHYIRWHLFVYFIGRSQRTDVTNWELFSDSHDTAYKEPLFLGQLRHLTTPLEETKFRLLGGSIYIDMIDELLRHPLAMTRFKDDVQWLYKSFHRKTSGSFAYFLRHFVVPTCMTRDRFLPIALTIEELPTVHMYDMPRLPNYDWVKWALVHSYLWTAPDIYAAYSSKFRCSQLPADMVMFFKICDIPFAPEE